MNDVDLLIFDCDGVLIDSEPLACRTLAECVTRGGLPITGHEVHVQYTGKSEAELKQALATRGLADVEAVFAAWHEQLFAAFRDELLVMKDMTELLRGLDIARCVASNSTVDRLGRSLGLTEIWEVFAPHVFSAEMVAAPKPAPDLVLHCLDKMNVSAPHALMIDDSPQGIHSARAAGVRAIGFVAHNETRPNRREVLLEAGAMSVATGASELRQQLAPLLRATDRQLVQAANRSTGVP